jgi:hypothetical protein
LLKAVDAQAADADLSKPLRVIFIIGASRARYSRLGRSFRRTAIVRKVRGNPKKGDADETILGNPRNRPETNGG